ncbi:hypothetical protein [Spiribacter onubensis]|uniref:Flp pilus-assembly TadG-like N-terminal domain-containing protein n=1 Tax=Spiribacter onubensis TaxID=3122420 RepID=A0ABV3S9B5_9GAMM
MRRTDRQSGQIMPVVLASLAIGIAAIFISHRVSRAVTQESVVVNAADAAAYSGASWTARRLNLIAYTNRALVANHIAVGHLTAYVSWLRYVDQGADRIANYTRYIPYVGAATTAAERIVATALVGSEQTAGLMIRGFDLLHRLMALTQLDARRGLRPARVDEVMHRVARQYGESLEVNQREPMDSIPQPYQAAMDGLLIGRRVSAYLKLQRTRAGRDRGYFARLVSRTIDQDPDLERWMRGSRSRATARFGSGGRTWDLSLPLTVRFRKQGNTHQPPLPDAGGWRSADRLQVGFFNLGKFEWGSWATIAGGRADADRLSGGYRGVHHYTRLRERQADNELMRVPALVTAPLDRMGDQRAINAHLSMASVRYHVPARCRRRCPGPDNPASLFNPYWEAGLVTPSVDGLP